MMSEVNTMSKKEINAKVAELYSTIKENKKKVAEQLGLYKSAAKDVASSAKYYESAKKAFEKKANAKNTDKFEAARAELVENAQVYQTVANNINYLANAIREIGRAHV